MDGVVPGFAAVIVVVAGVALALVVPPLARARSSRCRSMVGVPVAILLLAAVPLVFSAGVGRTAAALLPLGGMAVAAAGLVRVLHGSMRLPAAVATSVVSCLLLAAMVLPFLGDALVEPGGPGHYSAAVIEALLDGSPLAAAVGDGLGIDFLRAPRAYGADAGGGLSRIGAYFSYDYPAAPGAAAAWALAGILLLWLDRAFAARRRTAENPVPVRPST